MQCALCKSSEKDDVLHGEFLRKGRVAVHYYCLLLTTVMEQNGDDNEGIRGFLVPDIIECAKKSENKKCTYCRDTGANIACCNRKCFRFFHTVCGAKNNARYIFYDTFQSFCHRHIDLPEDKNPHDPEELCTICCDSLGAYHPLNSIRPPCCSSGWFHRLCLARAALSAGYFFRCPLCNDEKKFRNFLTHRNVFIPDRDASWELAPRAFSELERKISCTAPICLCPTGRETNTNHWKMRICIVCGSKAIHMNCNKLYAHRRFTCDDCDFTLHEIERNKCMEATNGIGDINLEARSETDETGGQLNENTETAESTANTAPHLEHNDELMGRVLRSRTRSLDVEKTDFEGIQKENHKTHESVPIASTSTQAGSSTISPRKRTRSMFDNNNPPESKDSRALEVFQLHESHQSPPRKRTRSNTKGTVEPRRRSQRLAVQHCPTIVEEEEMVTPISIVDKDSATDDQGNNYEAYSESVIQPTSSTPILNSICTDKSSKSETFSDANQNETSIDLPKLALRKRANAVSHETFEDCDSFASEETASDTHILEESSAENNMRCSQRKSQQFSNEELPTIAEEPNEDENVEREAIIEKELEFESFSEDQGDQGDCKPPDESNSASNVDPEESVDTSTTSTATLHSIRSAKTPDSSNNNERVNRLKRPRTKRRRLAYAGNSSDSCETDNSKDESFEITSTERILRPRSNKTKKNQRRRSQRLLKSQSPIREETEDQTINNSPHSNENGETGTEENAPFNISFETTSNSTTKLNSTCVRMTPENDGQQPLKTAKARTKYLSESEASKSPKLCLRNRTHSMFSGLQVDHSIPLEDLKVDNERDTTLERTFSRPNKKSEDIMERDIFTERRRRSYRLEKQQTPIITQKLPTVALTEPDMRVLNNRNRPCRKAALYSRIRTFKMCDYFNSKCD